MSKLRRKFMLASVIMKSILTLIAIIIMTPLLIFSAKRFSIFIDRFIEDRVKELERADSITKKEAEYLRGIE